MYVQGRSIESPLEIPRYSIPSRPFSVVPAEQPSDEPNATGHEERWSAQLPNTGHSASSITARYVDAAPSTTTNNRARRALKERDPATTEPRATTMEPLTRFQKPVRTPIHATNPFPRPFVYPRPRHHPPSATVPVRRIYLRVVNVHSFRVPSP